MLVIESKAFKRAVEALAQAANSALTVDGIKLAPMVPTSDANDDDLAAWERMRYAALGALVSIVGSAAYPGDETHLVGLSLKTDGERA